MRRPRLGTIDRVPEGPAAGLAQRRHAPDAARAALAAGRHRRDQRAVARAEVIHRGAHLDHLQTHIKKGIFRFKVRLLRMDILRHLHVQSCTQRGDANIPWCQVESSQEAYMMHGLVHCLQRQNAYMGVQLAAVAIWTIDYLAHKAFARMSVAGCPVRIHMCRTDVGSKPAKQLHVCAAQANLCFLGICSRGTRRAGSLPCKPFLILLLYDDKFAQIQPCTEKESAC